MKNWQSIFPALFVLFLALPAHAATYTVNAGGGGNFTTIQACVDAAQAGDVCEVYAGTYHETVNSVRSGTANNRITIRNRTGARPIVTAFSITHDHITISGFEVDNPSGRGITVYSASYPIIENNYVHSHGGVCIRLGSNGANIPNNAIVRNNTVTECGWTVPDREPGIQSYGPNTLIEGNDISESADAIQWSGDYSVIRNNVLHDFNEDVPPTAAHIDGVQSGALPLRNALIEGNVYRNCAGGDCHFVLLQGLTSSGYPHRNIIIRYNYTNNASLVGVSVGGGPYDDRYVYVYNNTFTTGTYNSDGHCSAWGPSATNGVAKNNICYNTNSASNYRPLYSGASGFQSNGNLPYRTGYSGSWGGLIAAESTYAALRNQNPLFANYPTTGMLQSGSPARNAGVVLTTVAVADSGSGTSLVLTDASYFWSGTAFTSPDKIRIGTSTIATISSIDYPTNTVTLSGPVSRNDGDPVYLHTKSDGVQVLFGNFPGVGAYPYPSPPGTLTAPTNLRIVP